MLRPFHLCCFMLGVLATGKILTPKESAKELRIQCPEEGSVNGDLLAIYITQAAGNGHWTKLATWEYGERGNSSNNRVRVIEPPSKPYTLDAVLKGVTCYDAVEYRCEIIAQNNDRGTFKVRNSEVFNYSGEITDPVITREPFKDCYKAGTKLSLDCSANIARPENRIVWETKRPGGEFSPITWNTENVQTPQEKQENITGCTLQSRFPLDYTLSEEDDGRTFQCRLLNSGHTKQFKVSVQCDTNNCEQEVTDRAEPAFLDTDLAVGKSQLLGDEAGVDGEQGSSQKWLILLTVIPVSIAVMFVGMAVFLWQWRKRQNPQPLVVMDTPTCSDSGYGYTDRCLPELPYLQKQVNSKLDHTTTPKWVTSSAATLPMEPMSPNTSMYVSMTGIDCLRKEADLGGNVAADGTASVCRGAEPQPEEAGLVDEGLEPDMRSDRSESVYSNREAIERVAAIARAESMAVGASAHSTK